MILKIRNLNQGGFMKLFEEYQFDNFKEVLKFRKWEGKKDREIVVLILRDNDGNLSFECMNEGTELAVDFYSSESKNPSIKCFLENFKPKDYKIA